MKKVLIRIISAWCLGMLLICLTMLGRQEVQAATLGNTVYLKSSNPTLYYDMTGNGKKDTIRISCSKQSEYY